MDAVREVSVTLPHHALRDADWADAYGTRVTRAFGNAREAAEAIVTFFPDWTAPLMGLRQVIVSPFGLKGEKALRGGKRIGFFPVVSETPEQIVAGFNDRHLDFRIVVDAVEHDGGQDLTLTTLIRRHNLLGKAYLQLVLPFHRLIIRSALSRIAASSVN